MPNSSKNSTSVTRRSNIVDGRSGFRVESRWGHVSVLEGGGHICELILKSAGAINPLWKPKWKTIDPSRYRASAHRRTYGPLPEGRLLAGIAGHSISFDFFGPPSAEEIAAGHSTHGEAPIVKWRRSVRKKPSQETLAYGADLPLAEMRLERTISLDREQPIIYCEENATNLATFDRPISWNHHVTFGPPFLEPTVTLFDMPATRSKVCPSTFTNNMALQPEAEFLWPNAPTQQDGSSLGPNFEDCFYRSVQSTNATSGLIFVQSNGLPVGRKLGRILQSQACPLERT